MEIKIDDRVGDKIIVMSSAQYIQYQADPAAFLAWMERTGRLPEPEPKKVTPAVSGEEIKKARLKKNNAKIKTTECYDCGLPHDDDWVDINISDFDWKNITHSNDEIKLLCFNCMMRRFRKLGIVHAQIIGMYGKMIWWKPEGRLI